MAIVAVPQDSLSHGATSTAFIGHDLNNSNRYCAGILRATTDDVVNRVAVIMESLTGTSPVYRVSIQGVGAGGVPDGVIRGFLGNAKSDTATFSTGLNLVTLDETWTPTVGELYAVVIEHESGTINASNFRRFRVGYEPMASYGFPYAIFGDGTDTLVPSLPAMSAVTTGGIYSQQSAVMTSITANSWNNSGTPRYRGATLQPTQTIEVVGVDFLIAVTAGANFKTYLMFENDPTPVLEQQWTAGVDCIADGDVHRVQWRFDPVSVFTRTNLRFLVEPTTSTAITLFPWLVSTSVFANLALRGAGGASGINTNTLGSYSPSILSTPPVRAVLSGFEVPGVFFG